MVNAAFSRNAYIYCTLNSAMCNIVHIVYTVHGYKKNFLIYKEIQKWSSFKVIYEKGFLIYEGILNISLFMRRPSVIYGFATAPF